MSYIILPSRRTRQPSGVVRVNWASAFANVFSHIWVLGQAWNERGAPLTSIAKPGTAPLTFSKVGSPTMGAFGVTTPDVSNALDLTGLSSEDVPTTVLSVFTLNAVEAVPWSILSRSDSFWSGIYGYSDGTFSTSASNNFAGNVKPLTYSGGGTYATAGCLASSTSLNAATNGILGATDTAASNAAAVNYGIYLGGAKRSTAADNGCNSTHHLFAWGQTATNSALLREISAYPWDTLFVRDPRRIYIGAGATGGAQSGATDETASAADTPTAVSTRLASAAETGSAADTPTAVETRLASVAETTSSADTPTAVSTRLAAVAESASAAETTDATATGASTGTVAETASAEDTPSAISTRLADTAETGTATDAPTAVSTRLAAVAESASAAESTDGTAVPAGASACAETASAADTVTCVIVTSGSIAEGTASATDVCAAGGIWADFVAEVATAVATQYVIEPISGIAPDVSKVIDNSASRLGSAAVDRDSARLGSPTGTLRRPRL